uniref:C-type lectin domain-containing protein n=1 Tax=Neogobius melanostomus TaxID=47308 RepID=A0A8C6T0V8_9GOBI
MIDLEKLDYLVFLTCFSTFFSFILCVPCEPEVRCVCVSAVCFSLCSEIPLYHFVDKNLTWTEAQQFCRQHYHDLACVSSSEDNLRLPRPPGYSAPVWIGLYDDPKDLSQWKWTATNSSGSFQKWDSGEPRYIHRSQQCGYMWYSKWRTTLEAQTKKGCSFRAIKQQAASCNYDVLDFFFF